MGIGDFVSGIFGSKNKERAGGYKVDANAYNYGGSPEAAQDVANGYTRAGNNAQQRQGVQVDYGQAQQDRSLGMQARQGQQQAAQMTMARASGQVPSIASQQAARDMQAAQAAQASQAGSARGAAGLAAASRNAANNTANAQANISGQAQINAANERLAAEQSAAQQYGQMRGGDLASQGQSAQQAQAQAGFSDAQRARNDQMQMGMTQLANQVRTTQMAGQMNREAQQSANALGAQGINAGVGGQNAAMNQQNAMNLLGMAQGAAGAAFGSFGGGKAKGGPVEGSTPYLVGEEGPELVIPKEDGFVLTAQQTRHVLGNSLDKIKGSRAAGGNMGPDDERDAVMAGTAVPTMPPVDVVPRTWGEGSRYAPASTGLADAFRGAEMSAYAREADPTAPTMSNQALPGFTAGSLRGSADEPLVRRDKETVALNKAKQAEGVETSEEEDRQAGGAASRLGQSARNERKAKGLAGMLKGSGDKMQADAARIDTSYHGGGGYVPPALIPLQTRAAGGMIGPGVGPAMLRPLSGSGSGPDIMPGVGVQLAAGGGITGDDIRAASTGLAGGAPMRGMVGGGGITGGMNIPGANAREDGGEIKAGGVRRAVPNEGEMQAAAASRAFAEAVAADEAAKAAAEQAEANAAAQRLEADAARGDRAMQVLAGTGNAPLAGLLAAKGLLQHGAAVGYRHIVPWLRGRQ